MCSSSWFWGRKVRNRTKASSSTPPPFHFGWIMEDLTLTDYLFPLSSSPISYNWDKTVLNQIQQPYRPKSDQKSHHIFIINLHHPPITRTVLRWTKKKLLSEEEGHRPASPAVTHQCQKPRTTLPYTLRTFNKNHPPRSHQRFLFSEVACSHFLSTAYRLIDLLHFEKSFCHTRIHSCSMTRTWSLVSGWGLPWPPQWHTHPHISLS